MASETPVERAESECVLLSDGDGTILWASTGTTAVLDRDPEDARTETVGTLLGPDAPSPDAVGAEPITRTLRAGDDATALSVTAHSDATAAVTVYRCRPTTDPLDFEAVLARVKDAIVAFDTDLRYTYANAAAETLLGYDSETLLGELVWNVFPDAEDTRIHALLERAMETQESAAMEWYWEPTGQSFDVRCFPSPTGVSLYFRDVTEPRAREDALRRERDLVEQLLRVSPMGIAVHTPDGRFVRLNERAETILGIDSEVLLGEEMNEPAWEGYGSDGEPLPAEAFPLNVVLRTGEPTFGTEMSIRRTDGTRLSLSVSAAPLFDDSGDIERVVVAFEDITERTRDERQLVAQRDELSRLNRINELIRKVNRTVVGATDRATIQQAVCTELASERYPVVIAASLTAGDEMQVEHAAGLSADLLATLRAGEPTCLEAAMSRASTENTLTVVSELRTDDSHSESLTSLAATYDIETFANVPIAYEGVVCGVLTVGASDETAFTDREQSVLLELGQLLGTAIDAIRTKKLLYGSADQELKLAASARDAPLVELHDRLGTGLTFDSVVPLDAGRYLVYLVAETTQSAVDDAADGIAGIETVRVVESDHRPLVELRVGEATAVSALLDAGGWIRSAIIAEGIGEFVVDVPLDTDVRAYLDRVEQRGIDLGLLAKREVERTSPAVWDDSSDQLTARQRAVLAAAYRSGYFEWPRRQTTGEELADALDISSSTLHQHLRVASAKVLGQYVAANPSDPT
jgi:PAS domain S-box-containing protein